MKKIILAFMVFAMSLSAIAADNDSTKVSKILLSGKTQKSIKILPEAP